MHDLLVMCDELRGDDLAAFRSCGDSQVRSRGPQLECEANNHACEALAKASGQDDTADDIIRTADSLDALRWATGLKNDEVVVALAAS